MPFTGELAQALEGADRAGSRGSAALPAAALHLPGLVANLTPTPGPCLTCGATHGACYRFHQYVNFTRNTFFAGVENKPPKSRLNWKFP